MRLNRIPEKFAAVSENDPRSDRCVEVADLATRDVLPLVTQRKPGREALGLFAGVIVVGLLGIATLWSLDSGRNAKPAVSQIEQASPPPVPPADQIAPAVPEQAITTIAAPQPTPSPQPVLAQPPQLPGQEVRSAASPTILFDASALPAQVQAVVPIGEATTTATTAASPAPTGNSNDDFAARLGAGGTAATARATFNPRTTVTQGTLIPAVLETAIDTDVPGFVRAVVSTDVRSFDGSLVLIPRSSRLIGQYKSGLQAGQKRAYVIWTRLIRPDGVSVNLGSPAVGFAGDTGLPGKVNTHFFERFGSAMLLSVVGGLSAIGGNAGVVIASGGQSAAAAAVGQSGQIGPTVRVRQGQPVRVFTAKDLDFSSVASE